MKRRKEPTSVSDVKKILSTSQNGLVKNTLENCVIALKYDPTLKGAISKNAFTERTDIIKDLGWKRTASVLTDTDVNYIRLHLESTYGLSGERNIERGINIIANENQQHPIREMLKELKWDGEYRIRYALSHFLGADDSDYTYEVMKIFLLGAINRVYSPGCKFELMPCLVGGQGAGKSTFFRLLAIKDEWFTDDIRKLDDENVYRRLQGHWIIEMSEMMATANAKSIEEIKSFLSRQKDTYKVPYETHPADRLRQCVFCGTTNRQEFLPRDRSGNRRMLPILINPDKAERHILDDEAYSRNYMKQLWVEAMEIYKRGDYTLKFSKEMETTLKDLQQNFMPEDTWAGMIHSYLEEKDPQKVCSKQLYREALQLTGEPKMWELQSICDIMNSGIADGTLSTWQPLKNPQRFGEYGTQRGWERTDEYVMSELKEVFLEEEELPF